MKNISKAIIVLISAIIFTALFHRQTLGLNLLIFEMLFLAWLGIKKQIKFKSKNHIIISSGFIITSIATVFIHSSLSYITNILAFLTFIGLLIYPDVKSILNAFTLSIANLFPSQRAFISEVIGSKSNDKKLGSILWKSRIFIIPILILILFVIIYKYSNPVFDEILSSISLRISKALGPIFNDFDFLILLTFLFGILISNILLLRTANNKIIKKDSESKEVLTRKRRSSKYRIRSFGTLGLKNELKAAVFLLITLNALLLILNLIDINWVWLNFEWEGQYLKQFVHEGTYLLILSILISIGIVLYFFRKNLNFYSKNKLLKNLSYIWIAQNIVLTISVGIRNFYYINHFALAYKRIGVIIFLILTIYGLYTVLVKVKHQKSSFFLFKSNSLALFITLVICSTINWDIIIAKYNFNNADKSYVHLNYLASLSDKALPYVHKTNTELTEVNNYQKQLFSSSMRSQNMTPKKYSEVLELRIERFKEKWEAKGILSWNYAEQQSYKKLFDNKEDEKKTL